MVGGGDGGRNIASLLQPTSSANQSLYTFIFENRILPCFCTRSIFADTQLNLRPYDNTRICQALTKVHIGLSSISSMAIDGNAFVIGGGKPSSSLSDTESEVMELIWTFIYLGNGICKATAVAFAIEGVKGLLVADLDLDAAAKTAEESKAVATNPDFIVKAVHIDVTMPDSVRDATSTMVDTFGRIDYCVNGAGVCLTFLSISGEAADVRCRSQAPCPRRLQRSSSTSSARFKMSTSTEHFSS